MTKDEFFKMRDEQRALGLLKEDYQPDDNQNDLFPDEEKRILKALGSQTRGIFRTQDLELTGLLCVELYTGKKVKARRNKVDELDNITVWLF